MWKAKIEIVGKMGTAKPVLQFKLSPEVVSYYVPFAQPEILFGGCNWTIGRKDYINFKFL